MNIIVCIKQVPDAKDVRLDPKTNTMAREGVQSIMNPFDRHALEEAVRLKEQHGGKVTVISMGPPQAQEVLRDAVSCGADEAVLVSDRAFAGADTWATTYTLAKAIEKLGDFDLILCGKQAIDGDTAQVGPQTAEKLNIPQITYAEEIIDLKKEKITIKRKIDGGFEVLESRFPLLITVIKDAASPRPFKARRAMAYKNAKTLTELEQMTEANSLLYIDTLLDEYKAKKLYIPTLTMDDLQIAEERCGVSGSPTKVHKIESVVLGGGEHEKIEPSKEGLNSLIEKLMSDHIFG